MMEDWELLAHFREHGSEDAFRELMSRYLDMVYAAALRQLGDAHAAEDVTQSTFCLLARKASRLTGGVSLAGWLYKTAYYQASRHRESEQRRLRREREAASMVDDNNTQNTRWENIAPALDQAIHGLNDTDRDILLLRFFKGKPLQEVGRSIGVSEDAARMRVNRALDKLRDRLLRRGVPATSAVLASLLTRNAAEAAPAPVSKSIQTAVISSLASANSPTVISQLQSIMKTISLRTAILGAFALLTGLSVLLHYASPTHAIQPSPNIVRKGIIHGLPQQIESSSPRTARRNSLAGINKSTPGDTAEREELQTHYLIKQKDFKFPAAVVPPSPLIGSGMPGNRILTEEQYQSMISDLEQKEGVDICETREVTMIGERQAQMSSIINRSILFARTHMEMKSNPYGNRLISEITYEPTGNNSEIVTNIMETGFTFNLNSCSLTNGGIDCNFSVSWVVFLGYRKYRDLDDPSDMTLPIPIIDSIQATNNAAICSGQWVLSGPYIYYDTLPARIDPAQQSAGSGSNDAEPSMSAEVKLGGKPRVKQTLYSLFSVTVVDAFGNPVALSSR